MASGRLTMTEKKVIALLQGHGVLDGQYIKKVIFHSHKNRCESIMEQLLLKGLCTKVGINRFVFDQKNMEVLETFEV